MGYNSSICVKGKIWDLHIHTNEDAVRNNKKISKLKPKEYVKELLDVLNEYEDLEMISFTDHNNISKEIYDAFFNSKSHITLLPGVEIDVALEDGGTAKHLIVYFDAANDREKFNDLAEKFNQLMTDFGVKDGRTNSPIPIDKLLSKLIDFNINFALSPHAMKQGKRSIDYDIHSLPDDQQRNEVIKYSDQLFCFWEASGKSEVAHAVDYLKQIDSANRISIISFSDSKTLDDLKKYLDNPTQYFNALPNFNGLKLVGSEVTRISAEQNYIENSDLGSYIGSINFKNQEINLTPRLNAIIGGRGSGKSVLLDAIANKIAPNHIYLRPGRRSFLDNFPIDIKAMSGVPIKTEQFTIDYFNQNYITNLYDNTTEQFNSAIENYFAEGFEKVKKIDKGYIERTNANKFSKLIDNFEEQKTENIVGFIEQFVIDNKDSLSLNINDNLKIIDNIGEEIASIGYQSLLDTVNSVIMESLPESLKSDRKVINSIDNLLQVICFRSHLKKQEYFETTYFQNILIDTFLEKKKSLSKIQSARSAQAEAFISGFRSKTLNIRKRVSIINALIRVSNNFVTYYEEHDLADGENKNAFKFMRELIVEHPIHFMIRMFRNHLLSQSKLKMCNYDNLQYYIDHFCFKEDGYKKDSNWSKLYDDLKAFLLMCQERSSINYQGKMDTQYRNINELSPGTQTNILLEYIVHKKTKNPLLIDQPEDNIDNQTIFNKIRKWFMKLKNSRQVIVVTHDANIVINADAENVIIATQDSERNFSYKYGALEYSDILDQASEILDGGKTAVKRRLLKYGE